MSEIPLHTKCNDCTTEKGGGVGVGKRGGGAPKTRNRCAIRCSKTRKVLVGEIF